jgi:hypothetical protein
MKKSDLHPSKYFKAADFEGPLTLTIEMARPEKFENGRDEEEKLVVYFKKTKSGLVIGPIVWGMIADIVGTDETEKWPGHRLKLVRETTMFGGKRVPCIRPYAPDDTPAKKAPKKPPPTDDKPPYNDEVKF